MLQMRTVRRTTATLLVATMLPLAACSDDGGAGSATTAAPSGESTTAAPSSTTSTASSTTGAEATGACSVLASKPPALFEDAFFTDAIVYGSDKQESRSYDEASDDAVAALARREAAAAVVQEARDAAMEAEEAVAEHLYDLANEYMSYGASLGSTVRAIEAGEDQYFVELYYMTDASVAAIEVLAYAEAC